MSAETDRYHAQAVHLFERSIAVKQAVCDAHLGEVARMAAMAVACLAGGGKLLFAGNGGSAADAQHIAAEFVVRLRSEVNRRALPAIALSLDVSTLTAAANDYGYNRIYARAIEALGRPGDLFIGLTTSGALPIFCMASRPPAPWGCTLPGCLVAMVARRWPCVMLRLWCQA